MSNRAIITIVDKYDSTDTHNQNFYAAPVGVMSDGTKSHAFGYSCPDYERAVNAAKRKCSKMWKSGKYVRMEVIVSNTAGNFRV